MKIIQEQYFGEIIYYEHDATIPQKWLSYKYPTKQEVITLMSEHLKRYREKGWTIISVKIKLEQTLEEDAITIA